MIFTGLISLTLLKENDVLNDYIDLKDIPVNRKLKMKNMKTCVMISIKKRRKIFINVKTVMKQEAKL